MICISRSIPAGGQMIPLISPVAHSRIPCRRRHVCRSWAGRLNSRWALHGGGGRGGGLRRGLGKGTGRGQAKAGDCCDGRAHKQISVHSFDLPDQRIALEGVPLRFCRAVRNGPSAGMTSRAKRVRPRMPSRAMYLGVMPRGGSSSRMSEAGQINTWLGSGSRPGQVQDQVRGRERRVSGGEAP